MKYLLVVTFLGLTSCGVDEEAVKAAMAKPSPTPVPAKEEAKDKDKAPKDEVKNTPQEASKPQAVAQVTPALSEAPKAQPTPLASPIPRQYRTGDTWVNPNNGDVWKNTARGDICLATSVPTLKQVEDAAAAGYDNFSLRLVYINVPNEPDLYWVYDLKAKTTQQGSAGAVVTVCVKSKDS